MGQAGSTHQFGMGAFSLDTITVLALFTHTAELNYGQKQRRGVRHHAWQGSRVPEREGRVAARAVSGLLTGTGTGGALRSAARAAPRMVAVR